jgi:hypothetical protein
MKKIFLLWVLLVLEVSAFSQVSSPRERRKNPQDLKQLSDRYAVEYQNKKAEAEKAAIQKGWIIREEYPDGRVIGIVELGLNGMPEYNTTYNLDAARTTGTNELWSGGSTGLNLTGSGFTIGEWDAGAVRISHQEFRIGTGTSRVIQKDGSAYLHYHSTHVAGTMIAEGESASAHGMAPSANLHAYDWDNDYSEMLSANAVDGIILSNHSYGKIRGWDAGYYDAYWRGDTVVSRSEDYQFGFYGPVAKTLDSLAYVMQDFLFVRSAGNDRGESWIGGHWVWDGTLGDWVRSSWPREADGGTDGYDCIGNQAIAKNILTVGAVEDIPFGYSVPGDVIMTSFSAWGPTDDGRIKPDIVANGSTVFSTDKDSDNDYTLLSGTSMSSPNVCGTLALLQDYHYDLMGTYMYADELKALVINSAFEAGPDPGPDYQFGWGLFNAVGAAELVTLEDTEGHHISYYTLLYASEIDEYIYYADGSDDINVTIVWIDPPHSPLSPSLNPTTSHLVHDLDVRVIRMSDNTTYYPWKKNPASPGGAAYTGDNFRDNVEKVTVLSPASGQYKITVSLSGSLTDDQYYALVVSGMEYEGVPGRWTGLASSNWNATGNWDDNMVPDQTLNVTIPSGCPHYPVLKGNLGVSYTTGAVYKCDNLYINQGGQISIDSADLLCAGNIVLGGKIYDGDDLVLYNGAVLDLSGSFYAGYSDGYHGILTVNSSATINQTGGNLYAEEINLAAGCQVNATGGNFRLYKQGTANSTQNINIDDADSYFNYFYIDDGANARMYDCTYDLDASQFRIDGSFNLNGFTVTADYSDISGTLTMASGTFNVTVNGPYFQDGSLLTMSGGYLNGYESIRFLAGSAENVSGGTITLDKDFYNESGVFTPTGGTFIFEGSISSDIIEPTTFYNLSVNKTTTSFDAVENGTGNGLGVDISVLGTLDIIDGSVELNSPCMLSVAGSLVIESGAGLNANDNPDVHIQVGSNWSNQNLSGGFDAGNYSEVEFNAPVSSAIQIVQENNGFNTVTINSGATYVRPSMATGYGLIHARNVDIVEGNLKVAGGKIIVDEDLKIWSNLIENISTDSLIVDDIFWKSGSTDEITSGNILVSGSWTWENGTNASIGSGNLVTFTGSTTEFIDSYDSDAAFFNLDINKGTGIVNIYTLSTQPVRVLNNMNVKASSLFHAQNRDLEVDGVLDVKNGATMRLNSGGSVDLSDDFTLNGYINLNTGGDFYVHGAFQQSSTGNLNIQHGSFVVDTPVYAERASVTLNGTLSMSVGTFEITYYSLQLSPTFIDNITGGTIRVGGSFIESAGVFQPSGGAVEFIGNGNVQITQPTGCYFHDLWVSKNPGYSVSAATNLTIKGELKVKSATFSDNNKTITIGE